MVILIFCLLDGENMAMLEQFDIPTTSQLAVGDQTPDQYPKRRRDEMNLNLNTAMKMQDSNASDQKYISLQSPSRDNNPVTCFVKPQDFISLKPLTQDEETAILMQVNSL